ncbi:MAG TPA: hypothetical protein VMV77_18685 [Bacteroidales bacterium]|nr:hypothetical protein [Bacteroidales bacterium]
MNYINNPDGNAWEHNQGWPGAILCGDGTSGSVGELWYFFERELNYPVTLINISITKKSDYFNPGIRKA